MTTAERAERQLYESLEAACDAFRASGRYRARLLTLDTPPNDAITCAGRAHDLIREAIGLLHHPTATRETHERPDAGDHDIRSLAA
jgi:hypothetical protein